MQGSTRAVGIPDDVGLRGELAVRLSQYLGSLLIQLDRQMDVRLVRTFAATVVNIVRHRDRALSLLLTELGELLTDGAHAPAGVKRIERLLASRQWAATAVRDWLLADADRAVAAALARDGVAFAVLDGSVIEKPTASKLAGLTKVRSATGALLRRAYGGPPGRPLIVPGFPGVAAVVTGLQGSLTLARLHWYSPTAPGDHAQQQRDAEWAVLRPLLQRWGRQVIWLLDRGYNGAAFLGELVAARARLIVRWRADYHLVDPLGNWLTASELTRHLRSRWSIDVVDPRTGQQMHLGVASVPVYLPDCPTPLWLVVARRRGKTSLWFLTTEDARTAIGACFVVQAYRRRWQVEWAFRFGKADLGLASIRARLWEYRQKLWAMAELAYAFVLHLLILDDGRLCQAILRWCHRTGHRVRAVIAPLYRLRHGLANLWNHHYPLLTWLL